MINNKNMNNNNRKKYTFHVQGMHCNACIILTESELKDLPEVHSVIASLDSNSVEVIGDFGQKDLVRIMEELNLKLKPHGYTLSLEKKSHLINWSDFKIAIPVTLAFIVFFIFLQKLGIVNLVNASKVSYGTAFIIGLIASVSSCMAVVGGLVLSMSANFAKEGDKVRPQVLFHLGRLASFFLLGGVIGLLGSTFQLGGTGTFIISFIVAIILLILGLNLLDIFPWAKKLQPTLPSFIGKRIHNIKNLNHTLTPLLVGIVTFFLPCGFTQSMQIFALSTGSFWTGSLTMLAFALGTLPVLAILSFSTSGISNKAWSGKFFKTAGLVVIFFGLFNLYNSLNIIGAIPHFSAEKVSEINTDQAGKFCSLNNASSSDCLASTTKKTSDFKPLPVTNNSSSNVSIVNGVQIISLQVKGGYQPEQSVAKAGLPTVIRFETSGTFDCSSSIRIPSLNISQYLPQTGSTDINIGTPSVGLFRGSCGMGMYPFEVDFK